jgi:hypothetical protein
MLREKGNGTRSIANGGTTSDAIDMRGRTLLGVHVPTITSGLFEIEGSLDGATWATVKDTSGAAVAQWATSTGGFICDADALARLVGIPYLRFKCSASQGAERTITFATS